MSWNVLGAVFIMYVKHLRSDVVHAQDGGERGFNLVLSCIAFLPLSVSIFCLKEPCYHTSMLTWLCALSKDLLTATVCIVARSRISLHVILTVWGFVAFQRIMGSETCWIMLSLVRYVNCFKYLSLMDFFSHNCFYLFYSYYYIHN